MACIPCMVGVASAGPLAPIAAVGATAYYLTRKNNNKRSNNKLSNNKRSNNKRSNNKRSNNKRREKK